MLLEEVKKTVQFLKEGKVIVYPTDTIWGIGCDATSQEAVKKVYEIKKRAENKALILLLDDVSRLYDFVEKIPELAWDLIEFSEKPLTIIYPKGRNLPKEVLGEDGSVAIRVTKDEFCRKVISQLRKPLVSTSANISGNQSPSVFSEIDPAVLKAVDYVVNWRQKESQKGTPSVIMKLDLDGTIKFLRK